MLSEKAIFTLKLCLSHAYRYFLNYRKICLYAYLHAKLNTPWFCLIFTLRLLTRMGLAGYRTRREIPTARSREIPRAGYYTRGGALIFERISLNNQRMRM